MSAIDLLCCVLLLEWHARAKPAQKEFSFDSEKAFEIELSLSLSFHLKWFIPDKHSSHQLQMNWEFNQRIFYFFFLVFLFHPKNINSAVGSVFIRNNNKAAANRTLHENDPFDGSIANECVRATAFTHKMHLTRKSSALHSSDPKKRERRKALSTNDDIHLNFSSYYLATEQNNIREWRGKKNNKKNETRLTIRQQKLV